MHICVSSSKAMYSYMYLDRHTHTHRGITRNRITTQTDRRISKLCTPWAAAAPRCRGIWSPELWRWGRWMKAVCRAGLRLGGCRSAGANTDRVAPATPSQNGSLGPRCCCALPSRALHVSGDARPAPAPAPTSAAAPAPCQWVRRNAKPLVLKMYEQTQAYN